MGERPKRKLRLGMVLICAAAVMLQSAPMASAAPRPLLAKICKLGSGFGRCAIPQTVAANQSTGHIYVIDVNDRINEYSPWGEFIRAWGGGVLSAGATGEGVVSPGSSQVTGVTTISKAFQVGMAIEGTGIPPGTTIERTTLDTIDLSQPATAAATGTAMTTLSSPEAPGSVPVNEVQKLTVNEAEGTFKLSFQGPAPGPSEQVTAAGLPYNASPEEVQSALEGLSNIDAGDVAVTSPNPGGKDGVVGGPYTVEFKGPRLGDTNVRQIFFSVENHPEFGKVNIIREGHSAPGICTGTECAPGAQGSEAGQINGAGGIAVDPSDGDVYVYESPSCLRCSLRPNYRVQKFDAEGHFLLMFGAGVDEGGGSPSHPGSICTAAYIASGDVCGGGHKGGGPGEFGETKAENGLEPGGNYIAVGPGGHVYVGGSERIQEFESDGAYVRSLALPGEIVKGLAIDNNPASPSYGDFYVTYYQKPKSSEPSVKANVRKLDPDTGAELDTLDLPYPLAVATDPAGNVFAYEASYFTTPPPENHPSEIVEFDPSGKEAQAFGRGVSSFAKGIAPSLACGVSEASVFVPQRDPQDPFIALFGESLDPDLCPPPTVPPSIVAQFGVSTDIESATLRARINPHFWADTRYYVEYGTGKCSEGGCDRERPAAPGRLLSDAVVDADLTAADVLITGLEPGTTYHYRFVAASTGGGPIYGRGGTEAETGKEGTFRTLPAFAGSNTACPNQGFRTGASARLPDCRAYEMVSPLDKNNGDIADLEGGLAQAASDGQRMTFGSLRAFGDPAASPLASEYLAVRNEGQGWTSESISPPRSTLSLYALGGVEGNIQYKAFSDDLCSGWVLQDTDVPLTPGAPPHVPSLYRRRNCGEGGYELLTSTPPPGFKFELVSSGYLPAVQGFSADGAKSVFRANAALAVEDGGPTPPFQCTAEGDAETLSYQWLRNGAPIVGATEFTYAATEADEGTVVQCRVRASNSGGETSAVTEPSVVAPIPSTTPPDFARPEETLNAPPIAPTISGTPKVGETLTCSHGKWSGNPTFAYSWLRAGVPIGGANASSYPLGAADSGKAIQCEVAGTNAGGTTVSDSVAVTVEANLQATTAAPTVSGAPAVGETLTCNPGTWSGSPSFAYQWLRNGAVNPGATASTRTLAAGEAGKTVQCRVAATTADGTVFATSAAVVVSPAPVTTPPVLTAAGALTGANGVGATLTCNTGTWSGSPSFAFRWFRNGVTIGGATEAGYKLDTADAGKVVQCQVTATNAGGATAAINGSATGSRYVKPNPPSAHAYAFGRFQLYEAYDGGKLRLVSVLPDGGAAIAASSAGTSLGTYIGSAQEESVYHAVSADGSRVFWTAVEVAKHLETQPGSEPGTLYLRLNATEPQSAISGGECTEPEKACTIPVSGAGNATFLTADTEGTRAIYRIGAKLYEADVEEEAGHMVAVSHLIADGVTGILGASDDATRVYLFSTEALSGSQQNSEGAIARAGQPNLYLYEKGAGFEFVAILGDDEANSGYNDNGSPSNALPNERTSRVSPDGLHAAFNSRESLTGYDNVDLTGAGADSEMFVYDATGSGSGTLSCASCNPSGVRPVGRNISRGGGQLWSAAIFPGWPSQTHPSKLLSDDGRRLFFNSFDALVGTDTNGRQDVYEWEAPGSGDCSEDVAAFSEVNDGCLYLISSGQNSEDSEILDATPSGSDVFFTTLSSLLPQDYGLADVYDARVNGGFPPPPPAVASCEGEACQGAQEAPNDPTPASESFQGAGNVHEEAAPRRPKPCAKGKVKRHGKCVAKKHRRRAKRNGRAGR